MNVWRIEICFYGVIERQGVVDWDASLINWNLKGQLGGEEEKRARPLRKSIFNLECNGF